MHRPSCLNLLPVATFALMVLAGPAVRAAGLPCTPREPAGSLGVVKTNPAKVPCLTAEVTPCTPVQVPCER